MPGTRDSITGEAAARLNERTSRLSVGTALALGVLKLVAAVLTGSLSVVASLVDSVMDVVASSLNYVAVRYSGVPADRDHRYGHGKAEGLAGLAQGVFVGAAGLFLLVEGVRRIVTDQGIALPGVGIGVMIVSALASVWITWLLKRTARRTGSVALAADAVHYETDVWANLGVLLALVLIRWTGLAWIDGAVAVVVSFFVMGTAWRVLRRAAGELMDRSLPEAEVASLLEEVREAVPEVRGFHEVRSRKAGPQVFVDCHVQFDRDLPFVEAHRLSERVRAAIEDARPGALVNVHADPYPLLASDLRDGAPDVEVDPRTHEPWHDRRGG